MRLGDYIDDYCTRCKRSTDHSIAAMVVEEVQKVACRICHTEHPYRHNENPTVAALTIVRSGSSTLIAPDRLDMPDTKAGATVAHNERITLRAS